MLHQTKGIVLRSVKYGDSGLICTLFTSLYGVQTYIVQGVRSSKSKNNKAGLLQPATLLDMVVYHKPNVNMQRIKEYQPAYIYNHMQEDVVKNSIALFSVELLLRLLPEHAPFPELFDMAIHYFQQVDMMDNDAVANFPLYFIIQCSRLMGYEIKGAYTVATPYLDLQEGGFTNHNPALPPFVQDEDAKALSGLLRILDLNKLRDTEMHAAMRYRLLEWFVSFLQRHSQHMGSIKSLQVLQAILH